jgi:hypothetical protein
LCCCCQGDQVKCFFDIKIASRSIKAVLYRDLQEIQEMMVGFLESHDQKQQQ